MGLDEEEFRDAMQSPRRRITGHAPGHVRTALEDLLERLLDELPEHVVFITPAVFEEAAESSQGLSQALSQVYALLGRLWNCTDQIPRSLCDDAAGLFFMLRYSEDGDAAQRGDISTFGQLARRLRPALAEKLSITQ